MALGNNIKRILEERNITVAELARMSNLDPKIIYALIKRNTKKSDHAYAIAEALGVDYEDLVMSPYEKILAKRRPYIYTLREPLPIVSQDDMPHSEWAEIKRLSARGSCGGGRFNYDEEIKKPLIKENSFFTHFQLNPKNAIAIYADGDSMSDYIVDGDIVIFDQSKTDIISGRIYLIDHPDGLKIKEIRRNIDGSLILSSRNINKILYPDEVITKESTELLKICGRFVYRQGGM